MSANDDTVELDDSSTSETSDSSTDADSDGSRASPVPAMLSVETILKAPKRKKKRRREEEEGAPKKRRKRCEKNRMNTATQHLATLLQELLSFNKWDEAAKVLYALIHEPHYTSEIIWHAGFQILSNHPKATSEQMMQFAIAMTQLDIFVPMIVLECMVYFLGKQDLKSADEVLQLYKPTRSQRLNEQKLLILRTLDGYKGLMHYMEWKKLRSEIAQQSGDEASSTQRKLRSLAKQACDKFEVLFRHKGRWDLFVRKYIEIKEYYTDYIKLLDVVRIYCSANPDKPKSFLFQLEILQKYFPDEKTSCLDVMEELMKLDPSEEKLLEVRKYVEPHELRLPLQIVCNMVDHDSNRNKLEVWRHLADIIRNIFATPVAKNLSYLNEIWQDRHEMWRKYHFNSNGILIVDKDSAHLHLNKAIVFSALQTIDTLGDCSFIKEVYTQLRQKYRKLAKKLADEINSLQTSKGNSDDSSSESDSTSSVQSISAESLENEIRSYMSEGAGDFVVNLD